MAKQHKRKGDGLLGFGVFGGILGILLLGAPIGLPLLIISIVCLALWVFVRNQDNSERRHQETLAVLKEQVEDKNRQGN